MSNSLERVGACSPPGEKQAKPDSLKDTRKGSYRNSIERTSFGEDLRDKLKTSEKGFLYWDYLKPLTLGAELAMKIKLPRYAAPL